LIAFSGAQVHIASGFEATNDKLLSFADAAFSGAQVHIASGFEATNDKLLSFADASHPKKIRVSKRHFWLLD
jgi:hypothetical protein